MQILALAAILSFTSAAPSPAGAAAAEPEGYIISYDNEICEEAEDSGATQTVLTEGKCMDIEAFYSFKGTHCYHTWAVQRMRYTHIYHSWTTGCD